MTLKTKPARFTFVSDEDWDHLTPERERELERLEEEIQEASGFRKRGEKSESKDKEVYRGNGGICI
jgi:hypothetical protein